MRKVYTWLKTNWWVIFLAVFSLLSLLSEVFNGRWTMFDFEVYYRTAERMITGNEIYRIESDDYYVYKYAPTAGIFFMPFTILPLWFAKVLFWLGSTLMIGFAMQKLFEHIGNEQLNKYPLLRTTIFFTLLTVLIHVHSELTLGQVNIILLFIYIFSVFAIKGNKQIAAALLLASSIVMKPFGLIFLPYLLLKKEYKLLLYLAIFLLLLIALPVLFYPSLDSFIALYKAWIYELSIELGKKQSLLANSNHTIFSVLARFTPIGLLLKTVVIQKVYQAIVIVVIGWLFYRLVRIKQSFILEMSVLIMLIPLLAATSKNAYIFAMPLAMYLISHFKTSSLVVRILIILGGALIGGNIYDIFGHDFSTFLTEISIYSIGSILLLTATAIYSIQLQKERLSIKR